LEGAVADSSAIYANAQRWLDDTLASSRTSLPLRMEVTVGELDRRLRLAPCDQVQPYIPPNVRLWGKARLGLRCVQGPSKWNVFLPITVKAFGPAWVVKGLVAQGATLSEDDAMAVEVDWAELNSPIVANVSDWVGQTAVRTLSSGQALRQDMMKAAQVFQAGAQVRVLARGVGFEIATSAQAVSSGVVGQSARVRMDNGRVMTGQVLDSRTVRLEL
jgi:flagella basal body P-ring formation protein FlgA